MAYTAETAASDPKAKAMKGDEYAALLKTQIEDAEAFIDEELSQRRADAILAYRGEPFGDETPGRSAVVLTVVRDNISAVLSSLIRIFAGSDRIVEYEPTRPGGEAGARQATKLVNKIILEQNAGFMQLHAVLLDALLKKFGVWMWGWEQTTRSVIERYRDLTEEDLAVLLEDDDIDPVEESLLESPVMAPGPDGQPMETGEVRYQIDVRRLRRAGSAYLRAVPPEEFLIDRDARDMDAATLVGIRSRITRGELLDMGVKASFIDEHGGDDEQLSENEEVIAREASANRGLEQSPEAGLANQRHRFVEAYIRVDKDGDGIAELRRVCLLGPGLTPIPGFDEPVSSRPFAGWTPDPQPHFWLGESLADRLMDIQKTKSRLFRTQLDSASMTVFPRMAMLDGQVNVQDVLNAEIGAPIRERVAGAVRPLTIPFVGAELSPLVEYMELQEERRTGRNRGAAGLSAEALQSTTPDAAAAAIQGAEQQTELFARIFAEQCLKPTCRGLLRLLAEHTTTPTAQKFGAEWEWVDPREWDLDMDVVVKVALSDSRRREQVSALAGIAAKQWELIQALGPGNPIAPLPRYATALSQIAELENLGTATQFFTELPPDWQPPPPEPPPPTPEQTLAMAQVEVEKMRSERQLAIEQQKLELEALKLEVEMKKMELQHEREVMKISGDLELRRAIAESKDGAAITTAELNAEAMRDTEDIRAAVALAQQDTELEAARIAAESAVPLASTE